VDEDSKNTKAAASTIPQEATDVDARRAVLRDQGDMMKAVVDVNSASSSSAHVCAFLRCKNMV
jgi:hypothetical protein